MYKSGCQVELDNGIFFPSWPGTFFSFSFCTPELQVFMFSIEFKFLQNSLLDSVGEGKGGMIWENGIETCTISFQSVLVRWFLECRCSLSPSLIWPLPICLDSWTWHSRFLCNIVLYSIGPCFYHQSHPQLGIVFALASSHHSFWSYFSTNHQ